METSPKGIPLHQRRPTCAVVDLDAVAHNVRMVRQRIGPERHLMAVVKADAYGHGALPVARTVLDWGADWLGVALPEEGWELRQGGIEAPILVLGPVFPAQAPLILEAGLEVALFTREMAQVLHREASRRGSQVGVHIKVDTGMGRIGLPYDKVLEFLDDLRGLNGLRIAGVYTHLASAEEDKAFARLQTGRFLEVCGKAESRGYSIPLRHISNSAAVLDLPGTFQDLVRPGLMIYGYYPSGKVSREIPLRPAMTWKTAVAFIKELEPGASVSYGRTFIASRRMRVATLPVGYGDGLSRRLSNRGEVLIRGKRAPIVGAVCMDMTVVDVTAIPEAAPGDEVILFGRQGPREIPVEEVAKWAGTISYEILCDVGSRVPRVYLRVQSPPERRNGSQ